jgi:hypothetical protein
MYVLLVQLNSINNDVLLYNNQQPTIYGRMLHALQRNQCLFQFCCYEIDFLIEEDADLMSLQQEQIAPLVTEPRKKRK